MPSSTPLLAFALPLLLAAAPQMDMPAHDAPARATPAPCPTPAAALPAGLRDWNGSLSTAAATTPAAIARAGLKLGKRFAVTLAPSPLVRFVTSPEKPPAPGTFGGMAGVRVDTAGRYRIALGSAAWIDVLQDGKPLKSVAHDHGPACSGVRKMVDFALTPGSYVLQVSEAKGVSVQIMVAALP